MELNHPSIHATRGNLAMSYADAGRLKEAIAILEANLRISEARQGPDHPHTLNNRENLATVYQRDGQLARADALSRENLDLARKRYGSDDVLTLQVMSWRGITLLAQKKWIEAEPVLRECLAIREKSIPDDWRRFNTMSLLGQALLGQERYAEAEPLIVGGFEGVKAREASVPGISRKFVAEAADRVVRLYEAWGQPEKAAEWRVKLLGPTDPPPAASAAGDLPANPFAR